MADLLSTFKQAAMDAVAASNPTAVMFGIVTKDSPLEVTVDQRFTLTADFLIVPESLIHFELLLHHIHQYAGGTTEPALPEEPVVVRRGLQNGDKVLLLRVQGGQQYLILDRVVEA